MPTITLYRQTVPSSQRKQLHTVRYDPYRARELLEEAGHPDGIDVTLFRGDIGPGMREMAVAYQQSAAPAGIRVAIEERPSDGYWGEVWSVEPFSVVWWFARPNPDQALSIQSCVRCPFNAPRYFNQHLDDLVAKARGQDLDDQQETWAAFQDIMIENIPHLVLAFMPQLNGARSNLDECRRPSDGLGTHPGRMD